MSDPRDTGQTHAPQRAPQIEVREVRRGRMLSLPVDMTGSVGWISHSTGTVDFLLVQPGRVVVRPAGPAHNEGDIGRFAGKVAANRAGQTSATLTLPWEVVFFLFGPRIYAAMKSHQRWVDNKTRNSPSAQGAEPEWPADAVLIAFAAGEALEFWNHAFAEAEIPDRLKLATAEPDDAA